MCCRWGCTPAPSHWYFPLIILSFPPEHLLFCIYSSELYPCEWITWWAEIWHVCSFELACKNLKFSGKRWDLQACLWKSEILWKELISHLTYYLHLNSKPHQECLSFPVQSAAGFCCVKNINLSPDQLFPCLVPSPLLSFPPEPESCSSFCLFLWKYKILRPNPISQIISHF